MLRERFRFFLHPVLKRIDKILIFIRIDIILLLRRHINFCQIVTIESLFRHIKKSRDAARTDGSRSTFKIDIRRRTHNTHRRESTASENFQRILIIAVRHRNPGTEHFFPVKSGIQQAFIRFFRHPSGSHYDPVDRLRHRMDFIDRLVPFLKSTDCIYRNRSLHIGNLIQRCQFLYIFFYKSDSR